MIMMDECDGDVQFQASDRPRAVSGTFVSIKMCTEGS